MKNIKEYNEMIVNENEFKEIEEDKNVISMENNGSSSVYTECNWWIVYLNDGTEISIYESKEEDEKIQELLDVLPDVPFSNNDGTYNLFDNEEWIRVTEKYFCGISLEDVLFAEESIGHLYLTHTDGSRDCYENIHGYWGYDYTY